MLTAEDLGECVQAFAIAMAELMGVDEVERAGVPKGRYRRERTVVRAPYLIGRREMMTVNISSERLLMKSRLAGVACGSSSPHLRLLAAPFSTSGVSLSTTLSDRSGSTGNI